MLVAIGQDRYGTHIFSARHFGAAYRRRGYTPVLIDISQPDANEQVLALCSDDRLAFIHAEQGRALNTPTYLEDGSTPNLFRYLGIPVVSHLRDAPIIPWLRDSMPLAGPGITLFHADRAALPTARAMGGDPDHHRFAPHVFLDAASARDPTPAPSADRPIDLLYIGSYSDPDQFETTFLARNPGTEALLAACIEAALDAFDSSIEAAIAPCARDFGYPDTVTEPAFVRLAFTISHSVRFRRRARVFRWLLGKPATIVWSGPLPSHAGPVRAEVRPATRLDQSFALMDQARGMVMALNCFGAALSERLLTAMRRGCLVISHPNALIRETFRPGEDILLFTGDARSFDDALAAAADPGPSLAIAQAGQAAMDDRFSPQTRADEFLQALDLLPASESGMTCG